jgi:tRNA threonylcarbamoyladenosine biosynthesis protein TsaB
MRLVIETAGRACSVALFDDQILVAAIHEDVGRGHAEHLLPMIASLPGGGRAQAILVDCGPGSFTGVRVGLAAAHGLAIGWGIPVTGYSSLAMLACDVFAERDLTTATITIPGGHGEVFAQSFARAPFTETSPLRSVPPEAVTAQDRIDFDVAPLDARRTTHLPPAFVSRPAKPIYGRGADARPMA